MTVGQMKNRLMQFNEALEVFVRSTSHPEGAGGREVVNLFTPRIFVQEVEPDAAEDFVVLECDQDED